MNRYRTLAANVALISIGTFGSKVLVFLMVRFYTEWLRPGGDALWLLWAFVAASGYLILGLMAGSLFAIVMGPTTLADARPALGLSTFSLAGFLAGVVVLIGLEFLKRYFEQQGRRQLKGAGRRGH